MAGPNPFDTPAPAPVAANPFDDAPEAAANPFADPPKRPEPDMSAAKEFFQKNLEAAKAERASKEGAPKEAASFLEDLEAGWQMSVTGLFKNGQMPTTVLPKDAGLAANILSGISQFAGDLPAMLAGGAAGLVGGTVAGAAIGAPTGPGDLGFAAAGGAVGAGTGGFAAPAALRKILMDHYERGDIQDANEFVHRAMGTFWETAKSGTVGALTAISGGAAKAAAPIIESLGGQLASRLAVPAAEVATMTTAGAAMEGHLPDAKDFTTAAGVVALLHGLTHVGGGSLQVASKMRDIYAKTGIRPEQVAEDARQNPVTHQELLMDNGELPQAYGGKGEDAKPGVNPEIEKAMEANAAPEAPKEPAPKEGEAPPAPAPLDAAKAKIDSQMGAPTETKQGALSKAKEYVTKAYTDWVDRLDPIKRASDLLAEKVKPGQELAADKNPYTLSRLANDALAKVKHVMEAGTLDFKTLQKNGEGLKEILDPHRGDLQGLSRYLVSARALELDGRGIKSGFDVDAAKAVVADGKAKYGETAQKLTDFQDRNLKYLLDSGLISRDSYNNMREANKSYVPLQRVFQEGEKTSGGGRKTGAPKKIKGSDRLVQDPIMSILENTKTMFEAAEKNRAVSSFIDLAKQAGEIGKEGVEGDSEKLVIKSKTPLRAIDVAGEEVQRALAKQGLLTEDAYRKAIKEKFPNISKDALDKSVAKERAAGNIFDHQADDFKIFRGAPKDLGPNEFEVFRNGKREVYSTTPELAEAFKALDGDKTSMNVLLRLARGITAIKKVGITLTPDFILKNVFRDQLTAGTFSKSNAPSFVGTLAAIGDIVGKSDTYYNWLKSGGAGGSFLELDQNYLSKGITALDKQTGFAESVWNGIRHPVDAVKAGFDILHSAGGVLENATRLAEFKRIAGENSSGAKVFEGGIGAREVTVDFSRMGAKMSALNAITAFTNVAVQGLDRTARAVKEDPLGTARKAAMYITLPSVLLWWANKDDERVKAIPRWERDLNWIIATDHWVESPPDDHAEGLPEYLKRMNPKTGKLEVNKGVIYRLPKPQELGILFGSGAERALDAFFTDNPRALKDFSDTLMGIVTPNFVPDAIQPIPEQWANKSMFTGHQLIPGHLEKVAPELRYTEYTSETAKALGKLISWVPQVGDTNAAAPAIIDNYLRSYTGALGQYAIQLADAGLTATGIAKVQGERPDWTMKDIPAVKAFVVRYPQANAQPIVDFRERYNAVQEKKNTLALLASRVGLQDEWQSYFERMHQDEFVQLDGVNEALTNSRKLIQLINDNPKMSGKEKRQLIDNQYYQMIQVTTIANKMTDQMEKQMREAEAELGRRIPPSKRAALGAQQNQPSPASGGF